MRIFSIVLALAFIQVVYGQEEMDQLVTMDYEDEGLDYIFSHLGNHYNVVIRFNDANITSSKNTYSFDGIQLKDVLKIICRDHQLTYREYDHGKFIVFPGFLEEGFEERNEDTTGIRAARKVGIEIDSIVLGTEDFQRNSTIVIDGFVLDRETNEAVMNAMVLNLTTSQFEITDQEGKFRLNLDEANYDIQITSITHETYAAHISVEGKDQWYIALAPKAHMIDEIVISGQSAQAEIKEVITGLEQLGRREIKQLSAFMGEADVVKSLLTVAGVTTIGEGASGFNVRGGSIDQNLILQDGLLLMNPSHILGFFSTFNPDIVLNTSLHKGHIPAQYGGRISSVLDVNIKEGDYKSIRFHGSTGFISSKLALEVPVQKNVSSLILSGRLAYAAWLKSNVEDLDIQNSQARFNDFHFKYSHKIGSKDKLFASYFQSYDRFKFSQQFGFSWQNRIAGIQYKRIENQNLSLAASMAYGELNNNQFEPSGPLAFELQSGVHYLQLKTSGIYENSGHILRMGAEWIHYDTSPEQLTPLDGSQTPARTIDKERGREIGLYINDQWEITDQFSVDFGLRYSIFQQLGPGIIKTYEDDSFYDPNRVVSTESFTKGAVMHSYHGLQPRISLRFAFSDNFSLKASYNRLYQYLHLLSNATSPTPVDIWQVSNRHIQPVTADNYSLGWFHRLSDKVDYSGDFYYRNLENTVDHRDFGDLLLQEHLETAILKGRGRTYGMELTIKKSGEVLSGRVSYSYARSERLTDKTDIETINDGNWFSSNFDQPHTLKFFLNWKLSKRDRFDINFTYASGRPITAPTSNYFIQGVIIPGFSERNAVRLPSYHRLDVGYTFTVNRRRSARYKHDVTLAFYNLYARRNVFSVFYRQRSGTAINALQLSVVGTVIPSITYSFRY